MALNTDKFKKVQRKFATTLSAELGQGVTSCTPATVTGLPTDTGITITIDRVDATGTATPSLQEEMTGVISGSNVASLVRAKEGTTDQVHAAGAVVEMLWTETVWNDAVDGILEEHNQEGTHSSITADDIVIADGGTLDVDTINEATAANGVEIDGLAIKDSKLVTSDSVVEDNITDEAVTAEKLGLPVLFIVRMASDQTGIADSSTVTAEFDTEAIDRGSNFNTTDYKFTAPYDGYYAFNLSIRLDNLDDGKFLDIKITSDTIYTFDDSFTRAWSNAANRDVTNSLSTVMKLAAGEKVWTAIYHTNGNTDPYIAAGDWTNFSGHLIGRF